MADLDPPEDRALKSLEREEEAQSFYAPPREDAPPPAPPIEQLGPAPVSPVLVGFLTLSATMFVNGLLAYGAMALWYELTPRSGGFLSGLGEAIMAFLSWAAITAFALLSGIAFAAGLLGREGKVSSAGGTLSVVLGVGAAAVCFIPEPSRGPWFVYRGLIGLATLAAVAGLNYVCLRTSRRRWIGAPPPEPWMDVAK